MAVKLPGFYSLQLIQDLDWYKEDNPMETLVVVIGISVIVTIAFIINRLKKMPGPAGIDGKKSPARRFSVFAFRRVKSTYSLNKDQSRLLDNIFRDNSVSDPERIMRNSSTLDKYFKKTFKSIEKNIVSDEDVQEKLVRLFSLRNTIDTAPISNGVISSTSAVAENTPAVFSAGKDSHTIRVISSQGKSLIIEAPVNALGTPLKIAKGTKAVISFFTKSSKGFSFKTKVLGTVDTQNGAGIALAHSEKPIPLVQRRYSRKQTNFGCAFFLVFTDSQKIGRKQTPKLIVDKRRHTGVVLDISAGGCAIKTSAPVQVGAKLKIVMSYGDGSTFEVLGQVLRMNRSSALGTIIYIKFTKVPRRSFNNINAIVFGYDDD